MFQTPPPSRRPVAKASPGFSS
uniref:Uncharacterized protein n=1 Tax=Arundo donax TaxID=35708 RepID=A0A0A9BV80_ARUDO